MTREHIAKDDIRTNLGARQRRYDEIAAELGSGWGFDFHEQIMERLDAECAALTREQMIDEAVRRAAKYEQYSIPYLHECKWKAQEWWAFENREAIRAEFRRIEHENAVRG